MTDKPRRGFLKTALAFGVGSVAGIQATSYLQNKVPSSLTDDTYTNVDQFLLSKDSPWGAYIKLTVNGEEIDIARAGKSPLAKLRLTDGYEPTLKEISRLIADSLNVYGKIIAESDEEFSNKDEIIISLEGFGDKSSGIKLAAFKHDLKEEANVYRSSGGLFSKVHSTLNDVTRDAVALYKQNVDDIESVMADTNSTIATARVEKYIATQESLRQQLSF